MSSVGSPIEDSTISIDTMPACGMPAAPVLAAVTIKLDRRNNKLCNVTRKQAEPINGALKLEQLLHTLKVYLTEKKPTYLCGK